MMKSDIPENTDTLKAYVYVCVKLAERNLSTGITMPFQEMLGRLDSFSIHMDSVGFKMLKRRRELYEKLKNKHGRFTEDVIDAALKKAFPPGKSSHESALKVIGGPPWVAHTL